jgi:hypothetical protein
VEEDRPESTAAESTEALVERPEHAECSAGRCHEASIWTPLIPAGLAPRCAGGLAPRTSGGGSRRLSRLTARRLERRDLVQQDVQGIVLRLLERGQVQGAAVSEDVLVEVGGRGGVNLRRLVLRQPVAHRPAPRWADVNNAAQPNQFAQDLRSSEQSDREERSHLIAADVGVRVEMGPHHLPLIVAGRPTVSHP